MAAAPEPEREVIIEVPAGVAPGQKLGVPLPSSQERLVATVPKNALPGDQLIFQKGEHGEWAVKLVALPREAPQDPAPRTTSGTVSAIVVPQFDKENGCIALFIPPGLEPSTSTLAVEMPAAVLGDDVAENGNAKQRVGISVPPNADPGDMVLIKHSDIGIEVAVQKENLQQADRSPLQSSYKNVSGRIENALDGDLAFEALASALRKAGAYVSTKFRRASVPPLCIPGLAATDHIEKGEELMRIPRQLHLSTETPVEASPELVAEIESCQGLSDGLKEKAKLAAFLSDLLRRAEERAAGLDPRPPLPGVENVSGEVLAAWEAYVDGLLGVDFESHPILQGARDPDAISLSLEPSPQADIVLDMATEIRSSYEAVQKSCSSSVLGAHFELRHWVRARLCILSRVFEAYCSYTLVPVVDLMNHGVSPGVLWRWSPEDNAMIATAAKAHEPGDELFDSYGERSSELLFQTYGFTLPPALEPSWSYELRSERAKSIYDHFLPADKALHFILMESERIDETLEVALAAAHAHGQNPEDFLMLSCCRVLSVFHKDVQLDQPLAALQRIRSRDPSRSDWWTELPDEHKGCLDDISIRVKMSEYLCLTAHVEAVQVIRQRAYPLSCLARTQYLRASLSQAFVSVRSSASNEKA